MSFQLIHTSSLHLLDSDGSGYGTVARSEQMPKVLCNMLTSLSSYREPRGGAVADGPQFSYHIITHAGKSWHVLTCTQRAGADYSGRACHISHHLILSQEEVVEMLSNDLRPTPAGLILALMNRGFWKNSWEGEPCFIKDEPDLRPGDLPDAASQPTWKQITGHKANARAFFTPPFNRDCLVTIKKGTAIQDILRLFHESDWLTNSQGWGISFTTAADDADSYTDTLRMVVIPDSPLVQKSLRTGHPVLEIRQDMELMQPAAVKEPPGSAVMYPTPSNPPPGLVHTLARSVSHYHYTEDPDWLLYDVRPGRSFHKVLLASASSGLAIIMILAISIISNMSDDSDSDSFVSNASETTEIVSVNGLQMLISLTQAPYDHNHTQDTLYQLVQLEKSGPEVDLLQEGVMLLRQAGQPDTLHAKSIKRLCECARLLGVRDTDVVRLYLREATNNVTPEDWQQQFSGQLVEAWIDLKISEPQVLALLEEDALKAYAPVFNEPPTTTLLTTTETATVTESPTPADIQPARISLIPVPAVCGEKMPEQLLKVIPELPISISAGTVVVSSFAKGGSLEPPQRVDLTPGGFTLELSQTEKSGTYKLHLVHPEKAPSPVNDVEFSIRAGRLHAIRSGQYDAVVAFPVPTAENFHTNIILAPRFGIPVPKGEEIELPPAANARLDINPDDLVVIAPTEQSPVPRLQLKKRKNAPWVLTRRNLSRIRFTIELPVLTGHNSVCMEDDESPSGYEWEEARVVDESATRTLLRCNMTYRPDLPGRLERMFETVANSPCCGEGGSRNAAMNLAHLYYISCALKPDKLSNKQRKHLFQEYCQLFADKDFNPILHKILEKDTAILLTRKEATSQKSKEIILRRNVSKMLEERQMRDTIRMRVCEVLTRSLYAAYTSEQQKEIKRREAQNIFILDSINIGRHAELIWQFRKQKTDSRK